MADNEETALAHVEEAVGTERTGRRVVAWASVSMDGCTSGPGGPVHDQWLGGLRLLPDGLPASTWELAETTTLAHGAVCLHYRRP